MRSRAAVLMALWGMFLVAGSPALALKFQDGTVDSVKSDSLGYIDSYRDYWACSQDIVAWVDRQFSYELPQIYATRLSDPDHVEFLIDAAAYNAYQISMDYPLVAYNLSIDQQPTIRVADISSEEAILTRDITLPGDWPWAITVDGNYVSYICGDGEDLYVTDLSDANDLQTYTIANAYGPTGEEYLSDTALDGTVLAWCGQEYDPVSGASQGFLRVADITDPQNPQIQKVVIPNTSAFEWDCDRLYTIDISGDWMAAGGKLNGIEGIYAIRNFSQDFDQWEIVTVWQSCCPGAGQSLEAEPRIDGSIIVWIVENKRVMPTLACLDSAISIQATPGDKLMGAYLLDSGQAVTSVLQIGADQEQFIAAEISGQNVAWSGEYYDYGDGYTDRDYFTGTLQAECGDWGYLGGDVNRDCRVNLADLAIMAQGWLGCTDPQTPGCRDGEMFVNLD